MRNYTVPHIIYLALSAILILNQPTFAGQNPKSYAITVLSKPFMIDRTYLSMAGPSSDEIVTFPQNKKRELLWLTGFKAEVIDPKTNFPLPMKYFCHHTLQFIGDDIKKRNPVLGQWTMDDPKLASLVQGISKVKLPDGFGVPVLSNETLMSNSMVINPLTPLKPFNVQVKATYIFLRDDELTVPLKPLIRRAIFLRVPLSIAGKSNSSDDECCWLPKSAKAVGSTKWNIKKEKNGDLTAYHWFVPSGRHRYSYALGKGLRGIPYDTTIHYIEIHLHPYGTFCELKDLSTGRIIFKGKAKTDRHFPAVDKIDHYSTSKGIPIYTSHEYEIISEYNNTTNHDIDAMAIVYFYYLNKDFNKKALNI